MRRDYRLVYYNGEHMVCSKARRRKAGLYYDAWIYGQERAEFCQVGQEEWTWRLPYPEDYTNRFHSDRFSFAIDTRFEWSDRWEKVAGANNLVALRACYDRLVQCERGNTVVRLRHGSRIVLEAAGTEEFISPQVIQLPSVMRAD